MHEKPKPERHTSTNAQPKDGEHQASRPSGAPGADEAQRLREEAQQAKDQYLRTLADVENTRKRFQREKEEFVKFAAESMVRELLPIVDSLDQALVAVDKQSDPQAIIKGVHLIYRQLLGLLDKEGVKRIPTVGEPFDPHKHEAVAQIECTDGTSDDTIVEEVQVGYTMNGKVVRPAMVKVAKKAHSTQQTAQSSDQTSDTRPQISGGKNEQTDSSASGGEA
ncbi:MAG: nucleotide exchange factor GrpE [Candidatus Omnitrophica bacterium]|nr:nucleotide exchange factor GrpE [Candidatus Omnitrophota bacterium]